jgi:hypothetical protein
MADFLLNWGSFSATEAELTPQTSAGKARFEKAMGAGAVSCKLPKSEAHKAERQLSGEGFTVDIWTPLE